MHHQALSPLPKHCQRPAIPVISICLETTNVGHGERYFPVNFTEWKSGEDHLSMLSPTGLAAPHLRDGWALGPSFRVNSSHQVTAT